MAAKRPRKREPWERWRHREPKHLGTWVPLEIEALRNVARADLSPPARLVAFALLVLWQETAWREDVGGEVVAGAAAITALTGLHRNVIARALEQLTEGGLVVKLDGGGAGVAARWDVTPITPAWTGTHLRGAGSPQGGTHLRGAGGRTSEVRGDAPERCVGTHLRGAGSGSTRMEEGRKKSARAPGLDPGPRRARSAKSIIAEERDRRRKQA